VSALGVSDALRDHPRLEWFEIGTNDGLRVRRRLPGPTFTVPRMMFDERLVAAATDAGAQLYHHQVRRIVQRPDGVVADGVLAGRVVVAADGANSRVRRLLGHPTNPDKALAIAMRGYADAGDVAGQRIVLDDRRWPAYGWTFAIGDGTANVGWGTVRSASHVTSADLVARVHEHAPAGTVHGLAAHHLPLSPWRPAPANARVLLAGDAASLVNPLSGEGIFYALLSGALAGRAAVIDDPSSAGRRYAHDLHARLGRHLAHTAAVSRLIDHPTLRRAGLRAAARSGGAFDDLTSLALGDGTVTARLLAAIGRGLLG
jgi:flavin-dependent dehydrogenase